MKHYQLLLLLTLGMGTTGCAITSGLQTNDLANEGTFTTDLGTSIHLVKLTQDTLPALQPAQMNLQNNYAHLFNIQHKLYTLSSGDVLSIYLWAYPEITPPISSVSNEQGVQPNGYTIDSTGHIQFPIIGRYKAAGKTLTQVNQELRRLLGRYLKTPDVVVRILSYQGQRYSVQGNVLKGGQFYLNDQPVSLYTALGLAGGVNSQLGTSTSVTLVRQGRTYDLNTVALEQSGFSLHKLLIQPNDVIYVNARENQKIYVMGESGKNQALSLRDQGMTLSDTLGESLGLNPLSASRSKIYVVRTHPQDRSTAIYHLDLSSIGDFGLANQFKMQSNDIVYVDVSGLARWQRVISQVMPFSSMLYNVDRLGQ